MILGSPVINSAGGSVLYLNKPRRQRRQGTRLFIRETIYTAPISLCYFKKNFCTDRGLSEISLEMMQSLTQYTMRPIGFHTNTKMMQANNWCLVAHQLHTPLRIPLPTIACRETVWRRDGLDRSHPNSALVKSAGVIYNPSCS